MEANNTEQDSEQSHTLSPSSWYVHLLGGTLLTLALLDIFYIVAAWPVELPNQPWTSWGLSIYFTKEQSLPDEIRLLIIVILCGALGSLIHALKSFINFTGSQKFKAAWVWWYLLRAPMGALLALVFYFALRGGLLLLTNGNTAADFEVFGIASVATLVGLFTEQATAKLKELFDTLFTPKQQRELPDRLEDVEK